MAPRRHRTAPRRGSSEVRGGAAGNYIGVILIVLSVALIGGGLWFFLSTQDAVIELNPADLCPRDRSRSAPGVYVVLIDQTDPLPELQRRSVANTMLTQMRGDLEKDSADWRHARIEVWTFGDRQPGAGANNFDVAGVEFSLSRALTICNPGAPEKWDHLYKNADVVRRLHQRFYNDVEAKILQSLTFPEAKQSPVLEAVYGIGVRVFGAQDTRDARKRLILVSDLMQNTRSLTFFTGQIDHEQWKKRRDARFSRPDLRNVAVTVFMIPGTRPDLQNRSLAVFWGNVLTEAGAVSGEHEQLKRIQ